MAENNPTVHRHNFVDLIGQTFNKWTEETGIAYHNLHDRLSAGWSAERALTTPVKHRKRKSQ